jgi:gluconolactonase
MWNLDFAPPAVIEARVLTRLPDQFRKRRRTEWCDANKPGHEIDSFLEGPAFDRAGNLFVTDIPTGGSSASRPALEWKLLTEYDGWPNGLAIHRDGSIWIADYRSGLMRIDPDEASAVPRRARPPQLRVVQGLNDLTFDAHGACYFTDQGRPGFTIRPGACSASRRRPSRAGRRAARLPAGGTCRAPTASRSMRRARCCSSPSRARTQVWRGPLLHDGGTSKVGAFRRSSARAARRAGGR